MSNKTTPENTVKIDGKIYDIRNLVRTYPLLRDNARKVLAEVREYAKNKEYEIEDLSKYAEETITLTDLPNFSPEMREDFVNLKLISVCRDYRKGEESYWGVFPLFLEMEFDKRTNSLTVHMRTEAIWLLKHLPDNCLSKRF